jgi:hypothetical protein
MCLTFALSLLFVWAFVCKCNVKVNYAESGSTCLLITLRHQISDACRVVIEHGVVPMFVQLLSFASDAIRDPVVSLLLYKFQEVLCLALFMYMLFLFSNLCCFFCFLFFF